MMPQLSDACEHLIVELQKNVDVNLGKVDLMSIYGLFTADAIGQCLFGLEVTSLQDDQLKEFKINAENVLKM